MPFFNENNVKLGREFHLTFFCEMSSSTLFAALRPLGFNANRKNSISWKDDRQTVFTITPFKQSGFDQSGYILHFEGEYPLLIQLIHRTLSLFNPTFVNVEIQLNEGYTQGENIRIAEKQGLERGTMAGIYTIDKKIGIILLPNGVAILQARTKSMPLSKINELIQDLNEYATPFKKEEVFDLFTYESYGGNLA